MIENLIKALVVIAVAVALCICVVWLLAMLGIAIPNNLLAVLGFIVVLLVILFLWRMFRGSTWSL